MKSDKFSVGHFGNYGGQFVPETLMSPLEELSKAYSQSVEDTLPYSQKRSV